MSTFCILKMCQHFAFWKCVNTLHFENVSTFCILKMCQHFAFWKCVNILQLSQCSIREMNLRSNSLQRKHFLGEKIKQRHGKKWFFYSDDVSMYRRQQLAWRIVVRWLLTNVWGKPLVSHTLTEKETRTTALQLLICQNFCRFMRVTSLRK